MTRKRNFPMIKKETFFGEAGILFAGSFLRRQGLYAQYSGTETAFFIWLVFKRGKAARCCPECCRRHIF